MADPGCELDGEGALDTLPSRDAFDDRGVSYGFARRLEVVVSCTPDTDLRFEGALVSFFSDASAFAHW